jgi:hypothetical protein
MRIEDRRLQQENLNIIYADVDVCSFLSIPCHYTFTPKPPNRTKEITSKVLPCILVVASRLWHINLGRTPIFRLPGKEIKQDPQRLTDKAEADPENGVSESLAVGALGLLKRVCKGNKRELEHHAHKGNTNNVVCRDADKKLVEEGAEEEDKYTCCQWAVATSNKRHVDVTLHELVHGPVPSPPVDTHARGVPPVIVELAVGEAGDFGDGVQERLEEGKEDCKPDHNANG